MHRQEKESNGVYFSTEFCAVGRIAISTTALLIETIRRRCLCGSMAAQALLTHALTEPHSA